MWITNALLVLMLFQITVQVASSATLLSPNKFLISGKVIIVTSASNPSTFQSYYFTTSFVYATNNISHVYYATTEINAETYLPFYPGSSVLNFIWYEIDVANYSNTHLTTRIKSFLKPTYMHFFTYSYLIVLQNNPFIGTYMALKQLQFAPTTNATQLINYPTSYVSGDVLTCTPFIRQIRKIYVFSRMSTDSFRYYIDVNMTSSSVTKQLTVSIVLPAYVISSGNYSIKYLFVLIDSTSLARNLPMYTFSSSFYNITSAISRNVYSGVVSLSTTLSPINNYFLGISRYYFFNQREPSFKLLISYTPNTLTINFYGEMYSTALNSPGYFTYSYAFFPYYGCPTGYLIYNITNNLCYETCLQSNEYYNKNLAQCRICHFSCLTCYNSQDCRTCNTAVAFRQLVNFTCTPINGYFESNSSVAAKCSLSCVLCAVTASNCTKCVEGVQVLISGNCTNCFDIIEGCNSCNATACFSCNSSYTFFNQTYCNLPCMSLYCLLCSNTNTSLCFMCSVGYVLVGGLCQMNVPAKTVVCGDLVIDTGEECDDGNLINRDGCNSQCKVEQFYQCYSNTTSLGYSYTNYCAYTHAIDFSLISIEKLSYSNSLRIILSVKQYQEQFWDTRSTLSHFLVQSPIPYKNMEVSFLSRSSSSVKLTQKLNPTLVSKHPESAVIAVVFEYLQSIHGKTIVLSFNFSQSSDYALIQIPFSNITIEAIPNNNHYAALYSSQTYSQQKALSNTLLFIAVAAVFMMILTLFVGSKRISTEMLTVIQVAYASLLTAPQVSPLFSAVTSLSAANNGYNLMYNTQLRPFEDTLVGNRAKGAQFYSQFLYNFNVGTLFVILPLLVGVILFIVSKVRDTDEEGHKRAKRRFQLALGEFTFAGLTFSSCIVGVATVLEVQFGMKEIGTTVGMMSLLATAVFLFLYVVYGVILAKSVFLFQEYSGVILNEDFSLGFHILYFYSGFFTGALLCGLSGFSWVNIVAAVLPLGLYCAFLVKPIFRKQMDRLRTQLNLLTVVLLQVPFLYVNIRDGQAFYSDDDAILLVPITVAILLLINFLTNFSFIVYQTIKKLRSVWNIRQKAKNSELKTDSQYKMIPQNISMQLTKPMVMNRFIEYSQGQYKQLYQLNLLKPQQATSKSVISEVKSNKFEYSSFRKKIEQKRVKDNIADQI